MSYIGIFLCSLIIFNHHSHGLLRRDLAWNGGPMHLECEHIAVMLSNSGQYRRENVMAIKAVTYRDEIYVMTPRLRHGVPSTFWLLVDGRAGVELQAFPDERSHAVGDCRAVQNAVDMHLDHLGNIWILDSGIVGTMERPRCVCPPKIVTVNLPLRKFTKHIDLSSIAEPNSMLHNIVVEYEIGTSFVYISDASRGSVLVHDTSSGDQWSVLVGAPVAGLQIALVKRGLIHNVLIIVKSYQQGLMELDTATLRRKNSYAPVRAFGEQSKPVVLLGADSHHLYMRHSACADVLRWDTREAYNSSRLVDIHSPAPRLRPTSVAADPFRHALVILESNYADAVPRKQSVYHRITFVSQF